MLRSCKQITDEQVLHLDRSIQARNKDSEARAKLPIFTNAQFGSINPVYGFCDGNSLATLRICTDVHTGDNLTSMCLKRYIIILKEEAGSCHKQVLAI
jgi:hypothetical protein